jgi:3-deoxy-manno-octulosonate cytidylyltransferase (CMP-KDO synthetase)
MKFIAIIPARYASTRFPGKPLAMLGGKTVIQRVYEQAASVLSEVYVATDDERILSAVEAFGGRAVMTRTDHKSGTDRIEEAVEKIEKQGMDKEGQGDVIINIQGDEPFVQPSQIKTLMALFGDPETQIGTSASASNRWKPCRIPILLKSSPTIVGSHFTSAVASFPSSVGLRSKIGCPTTLS